MRSHEVHRVPPPPCAAPSIKHANVVQTQEPALKQVLAGRVLTVDPPGKVQHELEEHTLEERNVRMALRPVRAGGTYISTGTAVQHHSGCVRRRTSW